jgi:hypothetical protein
MGEVTPEVLEALLELEAEACPRKLAARLKRPEKPLWNYGTMASSKSASQSKQVHSLPQGREGYLVAWGVAPRLTAPDIPPLPAAGNSIA